MTLPAAVAAAWSSFADRVDVAAMSDDDWERLAAFVAAQHGAGLGLADAEEPLIEIGSRPGAPEFVTGELMAGVDVGLRVLRRASASVAAPTAATPAPAAPRPTPAPKPEPVKPEPARAEPAPKPDASASDAPAAGGDSELSEAEKKALGLA
jgi:hypothetical protein